MGSGFNSSFHQNNAYSKNWTIELLGYWATSIHGATVNSVRDIEFAFQILVFDYL